MSLDFAQECNVCLIMCLSPLTVEAVDGRPLGTGRITHLTSKLHMTTGILHQETIQFYIISTSHAPIILGLPWLRKHNPNISWQESHIIRWDEKYFFRCMSSIDPLPLHTVSVNDTAVPGVPNAYQDLSEAFSKSKASQLPPHRSSDCAIDLLPGSNPPKGRIFPLSQPESEAMNKYIQEEWAKTSFVTPPHRHPPSFSLLRRRRAVSGRALIIAASMK